MDEVAGGYKIYTMGCFKIVNFLSNIKAVNKDATGGPYRIFV